MLHGAKIKVVGDIAFTCVVLHKMLRTHQGGAHRSPTPGNDVVAQQNEQVVYVPNENDRNPSREAKHQREPLNEYINHMGEFCQPTTLGAEAGIDQSFSGQTNYSKSFYSSWCCSNFQ